MIQRLLPLALIAVSTTLAAEPSLPPFAADASAALPPSADTPYAGTMVLHVDATDTIARSFRTTQTIPVAPGTRELVLVYPKWLPGNHAPTGQIQRLGDVRFEADGATLNWARDPREPYAFRVALPAGVATVTARLIYTSPPSGGDWRALMTPAIANVQWEKLSLYPAGHAVRQIRVKPTLTLPEGWTAASALDGAAQTGNTVTWAETDYETLVDSPVFAGANRQTWDLGQNVRLNVFADEARQLQGPPAMLPAHKALVAEIAALFGTRQFDHYDFLLALTEELGGIGLEHHRSSENVLPADSFTDWDNRAAGRSLLPHEMVHSWNGKYRRPAGLWTPDYHTAINPELLWVYEGQTSFWDTVLAARSGLQPKPVALGEIAVNAAYFSQQAGRQWRSVEDTTFNPMMGYRKPQPYPSLSRGTDYYSEGALVWLEVDQTIRAGTGGKRGLDDFARSFFAGREGDWGTATYSFADVVAALNAVYPHDWAAFLDRRFRHPAQPAPIKGIEMAGYRLVWKEEPNPYTRQMGAAGDYRWSLGIDVAANGDIADSQWGSAGFTAGLVPGTTLVAVNGLAFTRDRLKTAVREAKGATTPIALIVRRGDRFDTVTLPYHDGLRFPWIEPAGKGTQPLDRLLEPRAQ